jgi:RimJ/RimL family protein N-acetyltransferase
MTIWETERLRLRAIEPADLDAILANDDDTEGARGGWRVFPPRSRAAAAEWIDEQTRRSNDGDQFRLGIEARDSSKDLVGLIGTHTCDPQAGTFSYAIDVFPWARRLGYGSDAVGVVLRYLFAERRYQKCTVSTPEFNAASIAFHHSLGFRVEGRLRRTVFTGGRHWDEVVLGLTAEEHALR